MDLQVKKLKVDISTTPRQKSPPSPIISPKEKVNYLFSQLRGRAMKTHFKMYCCKSTFLKHVTEECTFCWKVTLVTLSKNLVATITEFLSLFVNVIININIQ